MALIVSIFAAIQSAYFRGYCDGMIDEAQKYRHSDQPQPPDTDYYQIKGRLLPSNGGTGVSTVTISNPRPFSPTIKPSPIFTAPIIK